MPQAPGAVGRCGAHWGPLWFQWKWEGLALEWQIAEEELLPILFSMVVWGKWRSGKRVECHCDNMAVVAVVNSGRVKDKITMHMLRCMFFVAAYHDIHIHATHLPGVENTAADALSRKQSSHFSTGGPRRVSPANAHPPSSSGLSGKGTSRLVVPPLGPTIQRLLQAGLAPSTQRAYMAGKKEVPHVLPEDWGSSSASNRAKTDRIRGICNEPGAKTPNNQVLPVSGAPLVGCQRRGDPRVERMPMLELILRGSRKEQSGDQKRSRLPITPSILEQVASSLEQGPIRQGQRHAMGSMLCWILWFPQIVGAYGTRERRI